MQRYEVARECETEPGAARLGREERCRDAVAHRFGDSATAVLEVDRDGGRSLAVADLDAVLETQVGTDRQHTLAAGHRFERIAAEVQEHLDQAVAIGEELGNRRVEAALDLAARAERVDREQVEYVIEQAVQVDRRQADLADTAEDEEVVEQRRDAIHFAHDQLRGRAVAVACGPPLQDLGGAADSTQRVAHFVGDARSDLTERGDARALALDFAQRRAERQVAQPDDGAVDRARRIDQRRHGRVDQQVALEATRHADFVLDAGVAIREHRSHRLRKAARAGELFDRPPRYRLGRGLEDPAGLGIQALDATIRIDDHHAVEERIEHTAEVGGHRNASVLSTVAAGSRCVDRLCWLLRAPKFRRSASLRALLAEEIAITLSLGPIPVLHQFARSHYNEKARWGLDWKGIAHRRETHLPGPHMVSIRKLSGQSATPVLCLDGAVVAGSAAILEALETRFPERPLYPADPALRERALAIQRDFDAEVGVASRAAVFSVLLEEPGYLCTTFAGHRARPIQLAYRATLPLLKPVIAKANGVTGAAAVERAFARTRAALDFVERQVGASGYLVGDAFSIADLCCASLLAVVVDIDHPDMMRPRPRPARLEALLEHFAAHPTAAWVREQYARNRPPRCAVPG